MERNRSSILVAALGLALVAASCAPRRDAGGNLIIAAEQFPDCLNVVDSCTGSSWLHWVLAGLILPKAMTFDQNGNFVASPLLVEAPTLDNGGLTEDPFTVSFRIAPDAVWNDGSPITWEDFQFTWRAIMETPDSYETGGYELIEGVEQGADEREAVITFSEFYAPWADLFGGASGYVLKKAAFPGGADVSGTMQAFIDFSAGPWVLDRFTADQELVLLPNENYWGTKPLADQLTVVAREDQATELQALFTGEVFAIYPQPSGGNLSEDLNKPNVKATFGVGTGFEYLWFNLDRPPVDSLNVRRAFAYAADRAALVDRLIKPDNPEAEVLNCGVGMPGIGAWCNEEDFAGYTYGPGEARSLLEEDGWTCSDGEICVKDGQQLVVTIHTTAGNKGRADTLEIIKESAAAAGIVVDIKTLGAPSPMFTEFLPNRRHMMALYGGTSSIDPSVTSYLSADNVPTPERGGGNWTGWRNDEATQAMNQSDRTLDPRERLQLLRRVGELVGEELPLLPLYQKPLVTAWRTDKISGPIDAYTSSPLGPFYNIHEWSLR